MNDTIKTILNRRSVRKYNGKPVSEENIQILLESGNSAPSAKFRMPRHFIVLQDRAKLDDIQKNHQYAKFFDKVTLAIIVCGDMERSTYCADDCAAATQNILLAATSLELASCWCGIHPTEHLINYFRAEFDIPETIMPYSVIAIGEGQEPTLKNRTIEPKIIHRDKW